MGTAKAICMDYKQFRNVTEWVDDFAALTNFPRTLPNNINIMMCCWKNPGQCGLRSSSACTYGSMEGPVGTFEGAQEI